MHFAHTSLIRVCFSCDQMLVTPENVLQLVSDESFGTIIHYQQEEPKLVVTIDASKLVSTQRATYKTHFKPLDRV